MILLLKRTPLDRHSPATCPSAVSIFLFRGGIGRDEREAQCEKERSAFTIAQHVPEIMASVSSRRQVSLV